jgi:hypothetical protein
MRYILISLIIISFLIACSSTDKTTEETNVVNKFMASQNVGRLSTSKEELTVEMDISKYENLSLDELKEQAVGTHWMTLGLKYPDKIAANIGNLVWFKGEIDEIVPFVEVDGGSSELKSIAGKEGLLETRVGRNWVWFCDFKRRPCNSPVLLVYDATTTTHLHPGEKTIVAGVITTTTKRVRRIAQGSFIYDKVQDAPRMKVIKIEILQE